MFTAAELQEMRDLSLSAMDAEATILRPSDGLTYGQDAGEPAEIATGVRCRVVENGPGYEREAGGVEASVAPFIVQLDGEQDVKGSDLITVAFDRGGSATFHVVTAPDPVSFQINTRAFCRRAE